MVTRSPGAAGQPPTSSAPVPMIAYAQPVAPERYTIKDRQPRPQEMHTNREEPRLQQQASSAGEPGRNDPCPCGSGKKYKNCHGRQG